MCDSTALDRARIEAAMREWRAKQRGKEDHLASRLRLLRTALVFHRLKALREGIYQGYDLRGDYYAARTAREQAAMKGPE